MLFKASVLNYILTFTVVYSKLSSYSTSFLHAIADGDLSSENKLNFSIYAKIFEGFLLYGVDSLKNNFVMTVRRGDAYQKYVDIKFNNKSKELDLRIICGYNGCNEKNVIFQIEWNRIDFKVKCNDVLLQNISFNKFETSKEIMYPIPKSMTNSKNKIYFMIGNVGPYIGEYDLYIRPVKEQLIGCLVSFNFNMKKISFGNEGTKVLAACSWKCSNNNFCNGGLCIEDISPYNIITCDCSFTPLNGQYCNRSMKLYIGGEHNSYMKIEDPENLNVKMTWRQTLSKNYCLMEFVTKHLRVVIWINKQNLVVDNTNISQINTNEINYINVYITNNTLVIKFKDKQSTTTFFLDENTRINIGFSEKNKACELYQGLYDFHYNMTELIEWIGNKSIIEIEKPKGIWYLFGNKNTLIFGIIALGGSLLFTVLVITLYIKIQKNMTFYLERLAGMNSFAVDRSRVVYTETGDYGVVEDESNYDYIFEPCVNTSSAEVTQSHRSLTVII